MPFVTQIFSQIWARRFSLGVIVNLSFSEKLILSHRVLSCQQMTSVAQSSTDSGFSYKTITYDHRLMLFSQPEPQGPCKLTLKN
jgi:hypothetical protein